MPWWSDDFQFATFFGVGLSGSRRNSTCEPSSSQGNSFECYLSIWPFCSSVLSDLGFYSEVVLPPAVGLSSWILHRLFCGVFFRYFGRLCFVYIVCHRLGIFKSPLFFWLKSFDFFFFELYTLTYLVVCLFFVFFCLFLPTYPCVFFLPQHFRLFSQFLY